MNKDIKFNYQLIYKPIRHLYIRIKEGHVIVTCGTHFTQAHIEGFLLERQDKILKMLHKEKPQSIGKYQVFEDCLEPQQFFEGRIETDKNYDLMLKLYTERKIEALKPWLSETLPTVGLNIVPMKVKKLKGKYGSCHVVKKEITINSFMARVPVVYLKYVLLHEYAHLKVANHSQAFYRVLDDLMLNHKQIQKDLRKIPIEFR